MPQISKEALIEQIKDGSSFLVRHFLMNRSTQKAGEELSLVGESS